MTKPSWNDAPEWANVLLEHVDTLGQPTYAFAEDHKDGARFCWAVGGITKSTLSLLKCYWKLLETRSSQEDSQEAKIWDNTRWIGVGQKFAMLSKPYEGLELTYVGQDIVCYLKNGIEWSIPINALRPQIIMFKTNDERVEAIQKVIKEEFDTCLPYRAIEDFLINERVVEDW